MPMPQVLQEVVWRIVATIDCLVDCYSKYHIEMASVGVKRNRLEEVLTHSSECNNDHCTDPSCGHMKLLLRHITVCHMDGCIICKDVSTLVRNHALQCHNGYCAVANCATYRYLFMQQALQAHEMLSSLARDDGLRQQQPAKFSPAVRLHPPFQQQQSWYGCQVTKSLRQYVPCSPGSSVHGCGPHGYDSWDDNTSTLESNFSNHSTPSCTYESNDVDYQRGFRRCDSLDDGPIILPKQSTPASATSSPKKRSRRYKKELELTGKRDASVRSDGDASVLSTPSTPQANRSRSLQQQPIILPTRSPGFQTLEFQGPRFKVPRSQEYDSDSSPSVRQSSTIRRKDWDGDLEAKSDETTADATTACLQGLGTNLEDLFTFATPPNEPERSEEENEDVAARGAYDQQQMELTLSQISCDLEELQMSSMEPQEDEQQVEDLFKYLDRASH